jgi:putative ABC transport system permease protein
MRNFLKIAWRNVIRHKSHTFINVTGLALGITCCLFIFLWVQDEKGVDNFHSNGKNLYTVYQTVSSAGDVSGGYASPVKFSTNSRTFFMEDHICPNNFNFDGFPFING